MAGVEVRAVEKGIRMSAQKVRLVLETVKGKPVTEALAILRFLPQRAAKPVAKAVKSAAANAENNFNMDPEELVITRVAADEGRTLKRWRPRARGRVNQILKRSAHITVVVAEKGA
ncbi:MAG: 50S ribosomal protein L22 [Chloroflexi bacterium]|nr:50S ribosomal protein L22 [Chloroflexota bacterium]